MSQGLPQHVRRILVAEDNAALAAVVRFHLERAGLQVDLARNGREAWDLLQNGSYAMVITDQQMPEMSGTEICTLMRGDPRLASVPVLMLTAKSLELDSSRLREELGVRELLPKPFSVCELTETVRGCLACGSAG
jgi:two-component system alkaline phosphatase synthesis response regulator PhoP